MSEQNATLRYLDPKLSRGLVRQEERALSRAVLSDLERLFEPMYPARTKLWEGLKVPEQMLRSMAASVKALQSDATAFLVLDLDARFGQMKSRSRLRVSSIHVSALPEGAGFQVESLRISATQNTFAACAMATPLVFGHHLAERLLQRRRSGIKDAPVAELGAALVSSMGLVTVFLRAAHELPDRRLAIPFGDGLILGEVQPHVAGPQMDGTFKDRKHPEQDVLGKICLSLTPRTPDRPFHTGGMLVYRASTYIGEREMRPEQRALRDAMLAFKERHALALERLGRVVIWPETPDFDELFEDFLATEGSLDLDMEAHDAAEHLVAVAGYAKAMGNSGAAASPGPGFREDLVAHIRKKVRNEGYDTTEEQIRSSIGHRPPR